MKRNRVLILVGVVILAIAAGVYVYFEYGDPYSNRCWFGRRHHPHPKGELFLKMMRKDLDLTDEQYEKFHQIYLRDKEKINSYRSRIMKLMDQLDTVVLQDTFDEKKTRAILERIDAIKREERLLHIKNRFEMQQFLTPVQREKMDRRLRDMFQRLRRRFGPPDEKHPGPPDEGPMGPPPDRPAVHR
jgi:Spy/CpxP family protein refolding chaperone